MATKPAANGPNGLHAVKYSAGIFADMTVDGPEIGTLVMIADRAKNLPNRKTMGKQNPYCAARLGKEAKKTDVDKRGGQTPRWDQELRFTVHESPDYQTMKLSVFSEDKRTDLIGEAWVNLTEVIVPGGGKSDMWQGLNCKGKYAGEIRIELTFYDSRPKPEKRQMEDEMRSSSGKVKRRPLPGVTPDSIPEAVQIAPLPGRARHGPREIGMPSRANSMPPENMVQQQQPPPPNNHFEGYPQFDEPQAYDEPQFNQPDFLPQLPPSSRHRASGAHPPRPPGPQGLPHPGHQHTQSHGALPHSHSAPIVPTAQLEYHRQSDYHPGYELQTDGPEPLPDLEYQHQHLRQRRNDAPPGWENPYEDPYAGRQAYVEDEEPAPPPPMHSNSAPVVPHYSPAHSPGNRYASSPHSARHQSVSNVSPLQSIERNYGHLQQTPPHGHPARGRSMDDFHSPSPPQPRSYDSTPASLIPGHTPSPASRSPAARHTSNRHSIAEPYYATPTRPHPLSQEVSRARSPVPYADPNEGSHHEPDYHSRDGLPLIKPRAISPQPPPAMQPERRPRSSYNLQFPVRAFESSDQSPLSTSQPQARPLPNRSTPTRKSVSPQPSPISNASPGGVPFGPDSFDIHNPSAGSRASPLANAHSHASPYHIRPDTSTPTRQEQSGPIVGWDGREIDPSDHLPVDSWAPEPEKKTPSKTYGLGRDRDFGPRTNGPAQQTTPGSRNLSKDTVISFRNKSQMQTPPQQPQQDDQTPPSRSRLFNKSTPSRSPMEPLREHANYNPVPNPYAQQDYSRGFHDGSPGIGAGHVSHYDQGYGGYGGAPSLPPKVPIGYGGVPGGGEDALSREIAGIDLGQPTGSTRRMPAPVAYRPVGSHRERDRYY